MQKITELDNKIPVCELYVNTSDQLNKVIDMQKKNHRNFDIIIDFEDGVGTDDKTIHVNSLLDLAQDISKDIRFGIRVVNSSSKYLKVQLKQIVKKLSHNLAYITVPKVQKKDDIDLIMDIINEYQGNSNFGERIKIHALVEDQIGIKSIDHIASHPKIEALAFGIIDFVESHDGAIDYKSVLSPAQFEHELIKNAKSILSAAAARYKKIATHNVCFNIKNSQQIKDDAYTAYTKYGFSRMSSIHPAQIDPILAGFSLSDNDIEEAFEIIKYAESKNWKPIMHKGLFYDLPSYKFYIKKLSHQLYINPKNKDRIQAFFQTIDISKI